MKSAAVLTCSIFILLLVAAQFQSMDDIALSFPPSSTALHQGLADQTPSLFESAKATVQKAIAFINGEEKGGKDQEKTPYTLLLITGLFGFLFWGRFSFKSEFEQGLPQN